MADVVFGNNDNSTLYGATIYYVCREDGVTLSNSKRMFDNNTHLWCQFNIFYTIIQSVLYCLFTVCFCNLLKYQQFINYLEEFIVSLNSSSQFCCCLWVVGSYRCGSTGDWTDAEGGPALPSCLPGTCLFVHLTV